MQSNIQKQYQLHQSALYRLTTKKKLADILQISFETLVRLSNDNRDCFEAFVLEHEVLVSHPLFIKKPREIQRLKPLIAKVHKRIFCLLKCVITPDYLHSAIKGRSYTTNVKSHLYSNEAIKFDIKNFYPEVKWIKIYNFFKFNMQCEPDVAFILSNICCYDGHLPTGSSLSPILSFWANKTMFDFLNRVASDNNLVMTVYVDDIMFSGKYVPVDFEKIVSEIVCSYGYQCHKIKKFKKIKAKVITGLAIVDHAISIPHRRRAKVRLVIEAIQSAQSDVRRAELLRSLNGMVNEMKRVCPSFAQYALTAATSVPI